MLPAMAASERKLWYMQRLNLFAGLSKDEVEALAGRLHDRVLHRRQLILEPEVRRDRIYLVRTGAVRVYQISPEAAGAMLLLVAGAYIMYYWLTLGGLLTAIGLLARIRL
jgi:CRP-like cAMP-binding protein